MARSLVEYSMRGDAGRGKELEDLIAAARRTMAETMDEGTA